MPRPIIRESEAVLNRENCPAERAVYAMVYLRSWQIADLPICPLDGAIGKPLDAVIRRTVCVTRPIGGGRFTSNPVLLDQATDTARHRRHGKIAAFIRLKCNRLIRW